MKDPEAFVKHFLGRANADTKKIAKLEEEIASLRKGVMNERLAISKIQDAYERGMYSPEVTEEKLREKEDSINIATTRIQDIEDQIKLLSVADVEIQKLQKASEQFKYQIDNYDPKQKKSLINLFIERINMYSYKEEGKKWKVWGEVTMRFNLQQLAHLMIEGRTDKPLYDEENKDKEPPKGDPGARERT